MKKFKDIDEIRHAIDDVDGQILDLLSKRGSFAKEIGKLKEDGGKVVYDPSREKEIFVKLRRENLGPYNSASLHAIFREIISATRALEQNLAVSYLGPEATFTHKAAVEQFGHSARFLPQPDISSVFKEVEIGEANFGVVPIENSTEGVVSHTLDKFVESELKICGEIIISVDHQLLSRESEIQAIKKIYSHPHALAQCRKWLATNLPNVELHHAESTSSGAKRVVSEPGTGAIASGFAADYYSLNILAQNIQDQVNNFTRFLVLGDTQPKPTGDDKTSIAFVTRDKPGILYQLLRPLAEAKINLTKIESRPLKVKPWEYMFFIDLDAHITDKAVQRIFKKLEKKCVRFKVLGSYSKYRRL